MPHLVIVGILIVAYVGLIRRAMTRGVLFKDLLKAHFLFWYPRYLHKLKTFDKMYQDADLSKIAKAQLWEMVTQVYFRSALNVSLACYWGGYFIYTFLAPYQNWTIVRELDFIYREGWPYAIVLCWIWGTSRANIWANNNLIKPPSKMILEWGKLYRKNMLTNPLQVKLVEKYWYIYIIKQAMAETAPKEFGFMPVVSPLGIDLDASKLPVVMNTGNGKLKISLMGFPVSYEKFAYYIADKLENHTGLRTTSLSKSGENSVVSWQVCHKDLPKGIVKWTDAPKNDNPDFQYIGYNGQNWVGINWQVSKHFAVVGNTNTGKGVLIENIMAGSNGIYCIGDMVKDGLDFVRLQFDPVELEKLDLLRAQQKIDLDEYEYRCQALNKLPGVLVATNKNAYFKLCTWLYKQFLDRKDACRVNNVKNVFRLYQQQKDTLEREFGRKPTLAEEKQHIIKLPRLFLIGDESAAAFINTSDKDKQVSDISKIINTLIWAGRAFDIAVIQATQRASLKALGEARDNMFAISTYTSDRNIKMIFERDGISIPAPGFEGEYTGVAVMENLGGGYDTFKVAMVTDENGKESEKALPRIIYNRMNGQKTASLKETIRLWQTGVEALESTDEFVPVGRKVTIRRGEKAEIVDA